MLKKITEKLTFTPKCANCNGTAKLEEYMGGGLYNYYCCSDCHDEYEGDR
jgi:hypothetical protein